MRSRVKFAGCISIIFFVLLFWGCKSKNSSDSSDTTAFSGQYGGTQSPGDYWEWKIDHEAGTFEGSNYGTSLGKTLENTYSGTVAELPNKFLKLTVAATDDSTALDSTLYAVEFPGIALLCLPTGANSKYLVAATARGDFTFKANDRFFWVTMGRENFDATLNSPEATHGITIVTSVQGSTMTLQQCPSNFAANNNPPQSSDQCVIDGNKLLLLDSVTLDPANPKSIAYMMPNGTFVVDSGTNGGSFGMVSAAEAVDYTDFMSKEFIGFESRYNQTQGTRCVWLRTNGTYMELGTYTDSKDPATAEVTAAGTTTLIDIAGYTQAAENPGLLMPGALPDADGVRWNYRLMVNKVNGKYIILGFGRDDGASVSAPGRTINEICNLFLIEK
jgi:hypothetical protein